MTLNALALTTEINVLLCLSLQWHFFLEFWNIFAKFGKLTFPISPPLYKSRSASKALRGNEGNFISSSCRNTTRCTTYTDTKWKQQAMTQWTQFWEGKTKGEINRKYKHSENVKRGIKSCKIFCDEGLNTKENNIIISGLEEKREEHYLETLDIVVKVTEQSVCVQTVIENIEYAHRLQGRGHVHSWWNLHHLRRWNCRILRET